MSIAPIKEYKMYAGSVVLHLALLRAEKAQNFVVQHVKMRHTVAREIRITVKSTAQRRERLYRYQCSKRGKEATLIM
jgi:hypothetical protein